MLPRMIAALVGALMLAACNPVAQIAEAERQVEIFHARYNADDREALYASSAESFQEGVSAAELDGLVGLISERLGKVVSSERTGYKTSFDNGVNTTTMEMKTTFEKGEGDETFIFEGTEADMRLLYWNVSLNRLLPLLNQTGSE